MMAAEPVERIGNRYDIKRKLGEGGQGDVYEADDTYEGDVVALKLLTAVAPGGTWAEARILRRLSDPHILPIRNADVDRGRPYLVTEFARHGTLETRLAATGSCGLRVDDVVRLTRQACNGLARAHSERLLHNDVKPGNLFLNAEGECLVGDFGGASLIPLGATTTAPGAVTPETMAPEVAASFGGSGTPAASIRSDVYSLGATAYWLLAARPTYSFPEPENFPAMAAIVVANEPARLRDLAPHVPSYVAKAVERALKRDPADRFATVIEFAAALGQRPQVGRRWARTDEHEGHLSCWRGEPESGGSTYVVCLEEGARSSQAEITTRHASSGKRILTACRTVSRRNWAQPIRSVIRALS
jgi:eukaryotic-like serine/threonine-protein kinase